MHRLTFLKSATLFSSSSFQKSRSFDLARITLFQGRLGTKAENSGFASWNCDCRRNSDSPNSDLHLVSANTQRCQASETLSTRSRNLAAHRSNTAGAAMSHVKRVWTWDFFGAPRATAVREVRSKFQALGCTLPERLPHTQKSAYGVIPTSVKAARTESWSLVTSSDFVRGLRPPRP